MALERDPVSVLLDRGARAMLAEAYARPRGQWVMTRLADPTRRHLDWAEARGWDLMGPDNAPTASGKRDDARTRWGRAFVRALYHNHRWYGERRGFRDTRRMQPYSAPLQIQWGRRLPGSTTGRVLPAGRAVRIRVAYGGAAKDRAVQRKAFDDRIYTADGHEAGRHSVPADRDW